MSIKTPGYVQDEVGIHKIETGEIGEDGEPAYKYRESLSQKPPYQFIGGTEGGVLDEGGLWSHASAKTSTRAVFLPRGVFQVTGLVYGDCIEDMYRGFKISAYSLSANREEHPDFILKDNFLPSRRSERPYDGILRIDTPSKFIFEVDSESPLWTIRVDRLTNNNNHRGHSWSGLHPKLRKIDTKERCKTQAQRDAEFEMQLRIREAEDDARDTMRRRKLDRQLLKEQEEFMREQRRLERRFN